MPLFDLDDRRKMSVPHASTYMAVLKKLGRIRADEARAFLDKVIDDMEPDGKTGLRTFSSSHLGSRLSPWPPHLYEVARELSDASATEKEVQDRAALIFGQFVWERIMYRAEKWVFYDPNLTAHDLNREMMGKVYFERA